MANLRILWHRDRQQRYAFKDYLRKTIRTIADSVREDHEEGTEAEQYIEAESGKSELYDPFKLDFGDSTRGLWIMFADTAPTPDGALKFVKTFGFLKHKHSEPVKFICDEIMEMRALREILDGKDWPALVRWMLTKGKAIKLRPVLDQWKEELAAPSLFFSPNSLIDAMYLQAVQDATNCTDYRKCDRPGCPEWVAVGPGTGKKRTKKPVFYCTPKCQSAHAYMRKKGEVK